MGKPLGLTIRLGGSTHSSGWGPLVHRRCMEWNGMRRSVPNSCGYEDEERIAMRSGSLQVLSVSEGAEWSVVE